jgi:hypothetical protein
MKQGCQIFLDTIHQNGGKIYQIATKLPNGHNIHIPNGRNIFQIAIEITNLFYSKALQNLHKSGFFGQNLPKSGFLVKIYPNRDFWFENIPSGSPVMKWISDKLNV